MEQTAESRKRDYRLYSKSEVNTNAELLKIMYDNDDECFVRLLDKQARYQRSNVYPINSLKNPEKLFRIMSSVGGKVDIMLSLNPYRTMKSTTRNNLFCIVNIAVDVDYRKIKDFKDLEPESVIKLLEMDFFDYDIPAPTLIEYGHQIRLIYAIEPCYIPKDQDNVVRLAMRVSEVFAKRLKDYGAEKQNLESYFRPIGTINSKNNATVKIVEYRDAIRYKLSELQELWLDELPKWHKKRNGKTKLGKVKKLHNVYALNTNRLLDFESIQDYLNDIGCTDFRSRLCFLYRNYVLVKAKYEKGGLDDSDYDIAEEEMLKFNNNFNYPLRDKVIESATRVVNYRQYLYKNETLLHFLELDWELAESLGLQSIYKPKTRETRNKEYYGKTSNKRKKFYRKQLETQGKRSKQQEIAERREKIKDLLDKGLGQKDILKEIKISLRTYKNDIKVLKEQGLI